MFVVTAGIHFDDEVATLYTCQRGVVVRLDMYSHELRTSGFDAVADADVADKSADIVR